MDFIVQTAVRKPNSSRQCGDGAETHFLIKPTRPAILRNHIELRLAHAAAFCLANQFAQQRSADAKAPELLPQGDSNAGTVGDLSLAVEYNLAIAGYFTVHIRKETEYLRRIDQALNIGNFPFSRGERLLRRPQDIFRFRCNVTQKIK